MVRLVHYMGIVHPGGAFEVSTTEIQAYKATFYVVYMAYSIHLILRKFN